MKLPKDTSNTFDIAKEAINAIDDTTLVTLYSNPENNELVGMLIEFNPEHCRECIRRTILDVLGIEENTLHFFENVSDEEKEKLQALAMINYHTKELEKLNQKLV